MLTTVQTVLLSSRLSLYQHALVALRVCNPLHTLSILKRLVYPQYSPHTAHFPRLGWWSIDSRKGIPRPEYTMSNLSKIKFQPCLTILPKTLLLHNITLLCWNSQANSMCIRYLPTTTPIDPCSPFQYEEDLNERADRLHFRTPSAEIRAYKLLGWSAGSCLLRLSSADFCAHALSLHFLSWLIHVLRLVLFRYAASISAFDLRAHLHGHSSQWWTFYSHCLILPKPILCWSDMNTKHWKFWESWMVSFFVPMSSLNFSWSFS
jgi:hypothetical protein